MDGEACWPLVRVTGWPAVFVGGFGEALDVVSPLGSEEAVRSSLSMVTEISAEEDCSKGWMEGGGGWDLVKMMGMMMKLKFLMEIRIMDSKRFEK